MRLPSNWLPFATKARSVLQPAGLLLLLLSAGFALHSWNFSRQRIRAIGLVTENVTTFAPGGGVVYAPRIRFRADGTTLRPVFGPAADQPQFTPGAAVPVLYPPGQPQLATVATTTRLYFAAIWCGVAGVILLDTGLVLRRFSRHPGDTT